MSLEKKTIIITGASSGLGRALAINYSKKYKCLLFLFGRLADKLQKTAQICQENNAEIHMFLGDVSDKIFMQATIDDICQKHHIDLIIACAGVSAGTLGGVEKIEQMEKIFAVNLHGVINTIIPATGYMIKQRTGQIVIISSMAGIIGLASSPSYSASKAAVRILGQGLLANLQQYNVGVSVVIPGFIKTPMTDVNQFPMPFIMDADMAAIKIIKGIEKKKTLIAFPFIMYFTLKLLSIMPNCIINWINTKLPKKSTME